MFKLESYITPILLSYVDKYIKNFKPEDSQLSLWGGEVALHNLDLRLEVLEEELQLPFTFVSGHIHELIIHVPWTKLYSEPICITINTIECILKLRGSDPTGSDGGGSAGGGKERRKRPNRTSDAVAPPGYVQTMVSKIVSNITINCCNLIVKYVEEDIVMSMNVKNLTFQSANDKWEPEFSDFLSSQLMLHKIIKLTDVTICLDKRNASGKIDAYQEPVLYRCSMLMRWLRCYNSVSSHRASVSRLDIHCHKMSFNLSESQVPMMMRLLLLARALQNREVGRRPKESEAHIEVEEGDENPQENFEQESWTGWAWNLVPSLPAWSENWTEDDNENKGFTFQSGIYIDDLAFNLRVGECGSNEKHSWKSKVEPFLTLSLRGCLLDYICHDNTWVNSQLGICSLQLEPIGSCSCGVAESVGDKQSLYFESGSYLENYFSESLFSSIAIENCGEKRKYNFSWDIHQNVYSESRLLEKTPALAIDYLYMVEVTENRNLEKILELNEDLEYSDLPEHALCRTVMGPCIIRVNSGLLHRFEKVREAAALYDYQPYSVPPPEDRRDTLPAVTTEEYDSLEENIPLRLYQYTVFQPKVELYIADHPNVSSTTRRKISVGQPECSGRQKGLFVCVECQCMDARFISPMYPRRLVRSACLLPTLPQHMFHACHSHIICRVLGTSCHIVKSPQSELEVFSVTNLLYKRKEMFLTHLWDGNDLLHDEISMEAENAKLSATKAHMLIVFQTVQSLMENTAPLTVVSDIFPPEGKILEVMWKNIIWQKGLTRFTRCDSVTVTDVRADLVSTASKPCDADQKPTVLIFKSMERGKSQQDSTPFIKVSLQWPQEIDHQSHAPLLLVIIQEATFNFDPLFYAWLLFSPSTIPHSNVSKVTTRQPFPPNDTNTQSIRSGHRKVSDVAGSHISGDRSRRSQTPMSVHSSDKDRDIGPPPLVSQLSGLSIDHQSCNNSKLTSESFDFSKWLVQWFPIWQGLVISVDVAHWHLDLPIMSVTKLETSTLEPTSSVDKVCVCLPVVQVCSASPSHRHSQSLITPPSKLPVQLPSSAWVEGCSNFPWSVSLSDLSVWTVSNADQQYLLKPVTTKCTVGMSTRFATSEKDSISSLSFCIHNDTGALHISVNHTQAQILSNVLLNAMVAARSLYSQHFAPTSLATSALPIAPPSPTTMSESASVSEPRNMLKNVNFEFAQAHDEPVKLSVWLQWTLARMSVNFYQVTDGADHSKKRSKLALEVEDLMSSLDLQKVYSKIKLKVASANVNHYVRSSDDKIWQPSPYQGLVMCGYEEISPPSSGQLAADEGCGLLTATLTRAKCRSVHSRWGTPLGSGTSSKRLAEMKVPGESDTHSASFITEILVKLQPLDFLVCVETLAELSSILHPFMILVEEFRSGPSLPLKTTAMQPTGLPTISSASLPLLYLDFQAVRVLMPMGKTFGTHDTLVVQVNSVTLSPHAENPLARTPLRPDVFHMAEQARILTVPGSEVEDRQYEVNVAGFAISTGQWYDIQRCRKLPTSSASSNLRTMSENPALVWNSLGSSIQGDATEIVGSPKPNLMFVLAPLKISFVCAPAIVYHNKILVCGHTVEMCAVSDVDVKLTTNQMSLVVHLSTEVKTVLLNLFCKSTGSRAIKPSFVVELAEKQYYTRIQLMQEVLSSEHAYFDSGIDTADISSIETLQSIKMRGPRRVSRSPRYIEGPSVHSAHSVHSSLSGNNRPEREAISYPTKAVSEPPVDILAGSRSNLQKDKSFMSSDHLPSREKHADNPVDLFITAGKISVMLYEDINLETSDEDSICEHALKPLFHVLMTQPHMFYSQFSRSCSIQVSVYDTRANLGSQSKVEGFQPTFCSIDFPVPLLETCKGDPDVRTGVLPALFKAQWTSTPAKPAQVSIDLARPAKFISSITNLKLIDNVVEVISSGVTQSMVRSSIEPDSSKKNSHLSLDLLSGIGSVSFKSAQIIFVLQSENEKHICSVVEMSVASVEGDLVCTSRTRWGCNVSAVEHIVFHLASEGLSLVSSHHLARQLLLEPCNMKLKLELSWPPWLTKALLRSLPHSQLTIQSDYVSLKISPDHVSCLSNMSEAYSLLYVSTGCEIQADSTGLQHMSPSTPASEVHSNETDSVDTEQHYTDDLRAGAFQFMDATNTLERDQIPLPYQCVFWESSPPAIAWRYPQPRSLTNVLIFPVPFKSAPDAEVGKEDAPVVVCSLQYWSECRGAYQHYATFLLSETNESKVELPLTPSRAVSSVWRVLLAGTRDLNGHNLSASDSESSDSVVTEVPVVSPRALAACMRIDSFFNASHVPNFQACLNLTSVQVSLINQLSDTHLYPMPLSLEGYSIDGRIPNDHSFLWLTSNHFASFYTMWPEGRKIAEINGLFQLDILDYATLSQQNVIESFLLNSCIALTADGSSDVSVVSRPIAIRIGPSVTHTMAVSTRLWQQNLAINDSKLLQVLCSQYIFCNDTFLPIILAQVDTDEHIILPSRQCHMYSWRSFSKKPLIQVSVVDPSFQQLDRETWSSKFSIDLVGTHVCKIPVQADRDIVLFVKIVELSATQKKITVSGQLQILNQMDDGLDLRLMRPASDWSMEACNCVVPLKPDSVSPSLFLDRHFDDPQLAMRLRIRQADACLWTGDIPLKENPKTYQPWLVKVPLHEKHQFICVWCRVIRENIKGERKILVILSPMYAIQSYLPSSMPVVISNDQTGERQVSMQVGGQGEVTFLRLPGSLKENTHQLHLRTAANVKIFPFGYSYVDPKKIFMNLDHVSIDEVIEVSLKSKKSIWPVPIEEHSSIDWIGLEIENSYVQAVCSPLSPYCGTLLLQLQPWGLLVNMMSCHICIEQSGEMLFSLPSKGVVAPPKLEGTFLLGLKFCDTNEWFFSDALQLARIDWGSSFYMPRISGLVPLEGHIQLAVRCEPTALSLLTLKSQAHNEVRIVHICSSFIVSNSTSIPLQVTAIALRSTDSCSRVVIPEKYSLETKSATITVLPDKKQRGYPLEKWVHIKSSDSDIAPFICVSTEDSQELSCPLRVSGFPPRRRFIVPLPQQKGSESFRVRFKSFVLSVIENNGQTFLNIAEEPYPQLILHNHTDFRILCAEALPTGKATHSDFKIKLDAAPWDWYCAVDSHCEIGYSTCSADEVFPQISPLTPNFFVALAVSCEDTNSVNTSSWSPAIQLSGKQEQFISIPGCGDMKVHTAVEGYSTHLSIEAVSRVEICARDIRSRLSAIPECPSLPSQPDNDFEVHTSTADLDLTPSLVEDMQSIHSRLCTDKKPPVKLSVFIESCSLTLTAASTLSDDIEVSALTLDQIAITFCPIVPASALSRISEVSLQITLGDFQLDNQLYEYGGFDFPVVLMGQQDKDKSGTKDPLPINMNTSASQLASKFSPQALLAVNIILESSTERLLPKTVHLSLGPITAYIEDKFVMDLKKHVASLLSPVLSGWEPLVDSQFPNAPNLAWISIPLSVSLELQALKQPLHLTALTLDPIWLLLSVHSSMRVYIALDRSPLQFTQFCRRSVYTTSYNLGHTLSMHYLSGAIFGAGWVVSSLELLGSPGGFARTLGTGLRDFVSLPYHGILEGPWGFLVGVTHGSASLMKHFTAGTLTSVTKMASSVARNLDRLTLDAEHLERTEELRRIRPQGVTEGLLQGLTGLGISVLGAVGGLAHHPLQAVLSEQPSPRGLVTGVGRGLVGVFTKPLSGAADLVAMTGQGLLQGAGWSNLPSPRHLARNERGRGHRSALIKYSCKVSLPNSLQCLLVLEATLESSPSRFKAVTLILTSQSLVVLSADGDNVESQVPLVDIVLPEGDADPTMLTISFRAAPPVVDQRMWDFVNGCRYVINTGPPALETSEDVRPSSPIPLSSPLPLSMQTPEHQSAPEIEDANPNLNLSRCSSDDGRVSLSAVQPAESTAATTTRPPIIFHVSPQVRSHFLTLSRVVQRQMQNQGFQIL